MRLARSLLFFCVAGGLGIPWGCNSADVRFCYGDGLCVEPDGQKVLADGQPVCEVSQSCGDSSGGGDEDETGGGDTSGGDVGSGPPSCSSCTPSANDTDGDCINNDVEDANGNSEVDPPDLTVVGDPNCFELGDTPGETDPNDPDTDNDGVPDGCEDRNRNGQWDMGEMVAFDRDSDCDGVYDGIEDANHNGSYEPNATTTWPGGNACTEEVDCNTEAWCVQGACSDTGAACDTDHPCATGTCNISYYCSWCVKTCADTGAPCANDTNCNPTVTCAGLCATVRRAESLALDSDTDRDGILDGDEDRDKDGVADPWVDRNGDGCFNTGDIPGESNSRKVDSDDDEIPDQTEDANQNGLYDNGETSAWNPDTDCDLLLDGFEDLNRNGVFNSTETNPRDRDTDKDWIIDGIEDTNRNGQWDSNETNPRLPDTDGDTIFDGIEDANRNGIWDYFDDSINGNGDGCWDYGETAGELNPRLADTDGDGVMDSAEDRDQNGQCAVEVIDDPDNPGELIHGRFFESCAFLPDTDCDALGDGIEDVNRNGTYQPGELDPTRQDTDNDGLMDGCPTGLDHRQCEDHNNNGVVDPGESDPRLADSDGDGLTDGCEVNFGPALSNPNQICDPLLEDSDGDGISDGEEDSNQNCLFEPDNDPCLPDSSCPETDPRVPDEPPYIGDLTRTQWEVCATRNLKNLTYAYSARETHDYRLAFEIEKVESGTTCGTDADCESNEFCDNHRCARQEKYYVKGFGVDNNQNGFSPNDLDDTLYGHIFQSPRGVVIDNDAPGGFANRDVYGFVLIKEEGGSLNDYMQSLGESLTALSNDTDGNITEVIEIGQSPSQPTHDSLPNDEYTDTGNYPINFAQRIFRIRLGEHAPALWVRNDLLREEMFVGSGQIDPPDVPPVEDPVYGPDPTAYSYQYYTVYLSVVQRGQQIGPSGERGVAVVSLAMTQDDRCQTTGTPCDTTQAAATYRLYNDRVARLEDLTGGSALARFGAATGKRCEDLEQRMALADILWAVDDSKSMQQTIERLAQASRDAQAILTANAGIVGFRVALTTTNPSRSVKTRCQDTCNQTCANGECSSDQCDDHVGCYKLCPASCTSACTGGGCDTGCYPALGCLDSSFAIDNAVNIDATGAVSGILGDGDYILPGGGGTFYYEDTYYLDCDSEEDSGIIDSCYNKTGFSDLYVGCPVFINGSIVEPRCRLTEHAGFLGSTVDPDEPGTFCDTYPICLRANVDDCGAPSDPTCERVADICTDGPTVLASQMCDLIRAMGGLPEVGSGTTPTASARPHSAPEHGTRSARRLIESMLPALPADYAATCEPPCAYDAKKHLRLQCDSTEPGCVPCDPRTDAGCALVPLLTIFLSDEEDFFFKDDCRGSAQQADNRQLPDRCYWLDGVAGTAESCDPCEWRKACSDDSDCMAPATCNATGTCTCDTCQQASECRDESECAGPCIWFPADRVGHCACASDTDCSGGTHCLNGFCRCDRRAYCEGAGFSTAAPDGYQPDIVATRVTKGFTLQWRDTDAPQCESMLDPMGCQPNDTGCAGNYGSWASYLAANQAYLSSDVVPYSCASDVCAGQPDQVSCESIQMNIGGGDESYCTWDSAAQFCYNRCAYHTRNPTVSEADQKCACIGAGSTCTLDGDPFCDWVQGYVNIVTGAGTTDACQPRHQINDCRACKRFVRMLDAAEGVLNDPNIPSVCTNTGAPCFTDADCGPETCIPTPLVGFDQVGLVYSIVRQKGVQGFGGWFINDAAHPWDPCEGGSLTWGLGDGEAYRELSLETGGRATDVCADNYADFMGQVIKDIAALSAPYRLLRTPIAATIKVGIARPELSGACPGGTDAECPGAEFFCVDSQCVKYDYVKVPRSRTQGFYYSATTNSIAFTSDPVDGICANPGVDCVLGDGVKLSEILYAQNAPTVPRPDDVIYVSYRYWRPVPCLEKCTAEQTCMRIICYQELVQPTCPLGTDEECPLSYRCDAGSNLCELVCTPGELIDVCVPDVDCGWCQTYNPNTKTCEDINNPCICNPTGEPACTPGVFSSCGVGYTCDENCTCVRVPGCGDGFTGGGTLAACEEDLVCCERWEEARDICVAAGSDQGACESQPGDVCDQLGLGATLGCSDDGTACTDHDECGLCARDNSTRCTTNNDCLGIGGLCSGDSSPCADDTNCGRCEIDGTTRCTVDGDCTSAGGGACAHTETCLITCTHTVACITFTCTGGDNAGGICTQDGDCPGGACKSPCELLSPCEFNIIGTCADDGTSACTADVECGRCELDPTIRCTEHAYCPGGLCAQGVVCNISGGSCGFAYPACCDSSEVAACFVDPETGEADLFCRQECVCTPACEYPYVCEFIPGRNNCECRWMPF